MKYPDMRQFERKLKRVPPAFGDQKARRELLAFINPYYRARPDMGARNPQVIGYYRRCVDRVIRELGRTRVTTGVRVWKLHSSGFIVKTPKTTFGVDVIDSVVRSTVGNDLTVEPDRWDRPPEQTECTMTMTARQRQELARLVDTLFYTHQDRDHISWDLARLTLEAGHRVVVTGGIRSAWQRYEFADRLTVLTHNETTSGPIPRHRLGPLKICVFDGFQVSRNSLRACQCFGYLITTDSGVDIFVKGDANTSAFYPWLARQHERGHAIDLFIGNLFLGGHADDIVRLFDPHLLPGHDWDMIHPRVPRGTFWWKAGPWSGSYSLLEWQAVRGRALLLTWGESIRFVPNRKTGAGKTKDLALAPVEVVRFRVDGIDGYGGAGDLQGEYAGGSRWQWRGRVLEARPPCARTADSCVAGIYPLDLKALGRRPTLRLGMALAPDQPPDASRSCHLTVKVAEGWGGEPRVVARRRFDDHEPRYTSVSLAGARSPDAHLVLEVANGDGGAPPVAWLLDPHVRRGAR